MTEVLLPCPFCGGEAEEFTESDNRIEPLIPGSSMRLDVFVNNTFFGVRCPKCDVAHTNPFIEREYAIAAWNHRTAGQAELASEVSNALGEAMQAIEQIGIITAGCAQTHGDPGGGLEMANGYANDAFTLLAQVDAALAPLSQSKGEGL